MKEFLIFIRSLIILFTAIFIMFHFVIGVLTVNGNDMEPRMSAGDIIIYYRLSGDPGINDVVVLKKNGTEYTGRVIAYGGDKVEITNDSVLMVNDNMVIEKNIFFRTPPYVGFTEYPLKLKDDECFVLCDRREGGEDSRYYGPVSYDEILGTVIAQYRRSGI